MADDRQAPGGVPVLAARSSDLFDPGLQAGIEGPLSSPPKVNVHEGAGTAKPTVSTEESTCGVDGALVTQLLTPRPRADQ
jgi:hypothetical protein